MLMRLRPSFAFFGKNEWSEKNFIKIKGLENIFSRHFLWPVSFSNAWVLIYFADFFQYCGQFNISFIDHRVIENKPVSLISLLKDRLGLIYLIVSDTMASLCSDKRSFITDKIMKTPSNLLTSSNPAFLKSFITIENLLIFHYIL